MPAIALYGRFVARPEELAGIRADALATLGYVANWRAIFLQKSYFELFLSPSPLEHAWSLSIEEQFYVVWPLVVLFVMRFWSSRVLFSASLGLALLSMVAMVVLFEPARTTRVYYGTDTRACAILLGAALACLVANAPAPSKPAVRWLDACGGLSVLGLAWAWSTIAGEDFLLYRGGFWLTEVLGVVLIACALAGSQSFVGRALSFAPLRALGTVSYGAYLWHWPVNLVITAERCHVHGIGLHALRTLLTLGIAALSFRFVEQPIRRNGLSFGPARVVVPTAFAAAFLAVVLGTLPRPRPDQASIGLHRFVSRALAPPVPVRLRVRVIGDSTAIALGWVPAAWLLRTSRWSYRARTA
jgi:peptidoglycan/LPS O-acetylase OafA/YrhL